MTDRVESGTRDTAVIVDRVDDDDSASVVERVLRLAQKITDLLESPDQPLENATEAENVAYQIKTPHRSPLHPQAPVGPGRPATIITPA